MHTTTNTHTHKTHHTTQTNTPQNTTTAPSVEEFKKLFTIHNDFTPEEARIFFLFYFID
jgi:hypothetical protein